MSNLLNGRRPYLWTKMELNEGNRIIRACFMELNIII